MSVDVKSRSVARTGGDAADLLAVRGKDVALAIWQRPPPPDISGLQLTAVRDVRFTACLRELFDTLDRVLDQAGYAPDQARNALFCDIVRLAERFGQIMDTDCVEIRLEHVTGNACRKFHTDYVTARLITTYVGQGTQWIDGADAADCSCGDPHDIHQMEAGDVAIFKGRLWPDSTPAIHRSPPIEGSGTDRLMLVINPGVRADND